METLIQRWKENKKSASVCRNKSIDENKNFEESQDNKNSSSGRFNKQNQNQNQDQNSDTSSSESPKKQSKASNKERKINKSQNPKKQVSPIKESSAKKNPQQILDMTNSHMSQSNNNKQQTNKNSLVLDETIYKIADTFKQNNQQSQQQRIQKIRTILENMIENYKENIQLETVMNIQQKQEEKKGKIEAMQKIIKDLEGKFFESERQKSAIKQESQFLQKQIQIQEGQIEDLRISNKLLVQVQDQQKTIVDSNLVLREQLQIQQQQNEEQQIIFNSQVEDLTQVMSKLKKQLIEKHDKLR